MIETINALFGLPALSSLPDEKEALAAGDSPKFNAFGPPGFEQKYLGPRDAESPTTASLLSGFDKARITGALPPLPGSYAMIPDADIDSFPHYGGKGCAAIGITPEDVRQGIPNVIPEGFNSLPATLPGVQLSGIDRPSRRELVAPQDEVGMTAWTSLVLRSPQSGRLEGRL